MIAQGSQKVSKRQREGEKERERAKERERERRRKRERVRVRVRLPQFAAAVISEVITKGNLSLVPASF